MEAAVAEVGTSGCRPQMKHERLLIASRLDIWYAEKKADGYTVGLRA